MRVQDTGDILVDTACVSGSGVAPRDTKDVEALPACPICTVRDPLVSPDGFECNVCGHEWADPDQTIDGPPEIRDANGKVLHNGDDVTVIKDLKLNGKAGGIKVGTKIRSIRLVDGDHPVQGKVKGRTVLITSDKVKRA